jgi:phospholipid N-methyltransferase
VRKKYSYSGWELQYFDKADQFRAYQYDLIIHHLKDNIAEVGPGNGTLLEKYINNSKEKIHVFEPTKKFNNILKKKFKNNVKIFNSFFLKPTAKKKYKTILYFDVIEHIKDDKLEILKAYNSLLPYGKLIINVPSYQFLYSEFDKDVNHFRRYEKTTIKKKLREIKIDNFTMVYYDSIGFFLSLLSKFFSGNYKNNLSLKIKIWNKLIFVSRILDKITFHYFGKSLLIIIKKTN